jgi:hypothetical protein
MPKSCSICRHPDREAIETAILSGEPIRSVASRYEPSRAAFQRHAAGCLREKIAVARARNGISAESLWSRVLSLQQEVETVLAEARRTKNHSLTLSAIARAEKLIALQGAILSSARGSSEARDDHVEQALAELRRRREARRAIETKALPSV